MWCTCLPLFAPCVPPSACGRVPRPRLLLPLCASRAALAACVPCSPLLYPCPAALTPLSLPPPLSSTHHLTASQPFVTRRGVACPSPSGYYRLLSLPVLYTLPSSPLAGTTYAADAPTLPPGVGLYPEASRPGPPMWVCVVWHDFAMWPTEPPAQHIPGRPVADPSERRPPVSPTAPPQHHHAGLPAVGSPHPREVSPTGAPLCSLSAPIV